MSRKNVILNKITDRSSVTDCKYFNQSSDDGYQLTGNLLCEDCPFETEKLFIKMTGKFGNVEELGPDNLG